MTPIATTTLPKSGAGKRAMFSSLMVFFIVGLLETILAYSMFSRADDHEYFLELANLGLSVVPDYGHDSMYLKATTAGTAFYALTSPSRWLGGHELLHLLWLRALTLAGCLAAFSWLHHLAAPHASPSHRQRARVTFMTLVLLYPGQLAWTASLLRDGVATALFFVGLACLRKDLRLILTLPFFGASFALRPEYAVILGCLFLALMLHREMARVSWRVLTLIIALLLFSVASHPIQVASATFSQFAFGDDGMAYPLANGPLDLFGYLRIALQGILDPIALDAPQLSAFGLIECAFIIYVLWQSRLLLRDRSTIMAAMCAAVLFGLWIFAYFEIYVSGFSRHRLSLVIILLALIAIYRSNRRPPRSAAVSK